MIGAAAASEPFYGDDGLEMGRKWRPRRIRNSQPTDTHTGRLFTAHRLPPHSHALHNRHSKCRRPPPARGATATYQQG